MFVHCLKLIFWFVFRLVSVLDLFSRNETICEVPTSSLKFFLLPVLLGDLTSKLVDNNDRLEQIQIVEAYYIDFLQRVKDYEVGDDFKVPGRIADQEVKPAPKGPPGYHKKYLQFIKIETFKTKNMKHYVCHQLLLSITWSTVYIELEHIHQKS